MKHQITVLLGCAMLLGACNKENVVEKPTAPVAMNYKIQPAKIGELRQFAEMKKAGSSFRISEESFSEEEFWLYTESVVNSLVTEFELKPDMTQERQVSYALPTAEYNSNNLLDAITGIQQSILNDLEEVDFNVDGTPYVHIVDVQWQTNSLTVDITYLAGISTGVALPANSTWQMTYHPSSSCSFYALDGEMQRLMHAFWNMQSSPGGKFRPNYLFSPPLWTQSHIPCCWTYTEVETRSVSFRNQSQRVFYEIGPQQLLWKRTMYGSNLAPACIPDIVDNWPRTLNQFARGTAQTGISLNPNTYFHPSNPNGLVLVGFSFDIDSESDMQKLGITPTHPQQTEYWHDVTFVYGRQIATSSSNL